MGHGNSRKFLVRRPVLGILFCVLFPLAAVAECAPDRVDLRGDWGTAKFSVEVADTREETARGLMFREHLPTSAGMLFVFKRKHRARFWMKNTLIPLDMLFIRPDGYVQKVHDSAIPGDLTGIDGGRGVQYVLEINGGLSKKLGISEGSILRHPAIKQSGALWPCE